MEAMLNTLTALQASLENLPELDLTALPPDTLVFTVDMNRGFTEQGPLSSPRTAAILPQTAAFLRRCREAGLRVYGISDTHPADSPEFQSYPPHCVQGTAECELSPLLLPFVEEVLPKNSTNALFKAPIRALCESASRIVVTGCCTDICVCQFAVGLKAWANAQNRALQVLVPVSLCETFDGPGHDGELMNLVAFSMMAAAGVTLTK